jgi:tetratricopeptide (TPR) repeat protein
MTTSPDAQGLARASALLDANRPEQALGELARLPAAVAVSPLAFELRAIALLRLERWGEAADAAARGLAAGGPDPDLFGHLGAALQELGDYAGAERALLSGLAQAPNDATPLCRYALVCLRVGQVDKADQLLARAAAQSPHAPSVYATRIQLAYARGDDRGAQRLSAEFLAEYPEHPMALAMHGATAGNRGHVVPAYSSLRQAVAAEPTDRDYAEAAWDAKVNAHPLLAPLRPLFRLGPVKTWLIAIAVIFGLRAVGLTVLAGVAGLCWLLYCVYSWTAPALVRRLVRRR